MARRPGAPQVYPRIPVNPVGAGLCSARIPRPPQGVPRPCHSERSEESHPPSQRATARVAPTFLAASAPPHSRKPRRGGALLRPSLASPVKGRGTARRRWWDLSPSLVRAERAGQFLSEPAGSAYKNQKSALPTVRGWSSTSRMLLTPVRYITMRSKPRPKPA